MDDARELLIRRAARVSCSGHTADWFDPGDATTARVACNGFLDFNQTIDDLGEAIDVWLEDMFAHTRESPAFSGTGVRLYPRSGHFARLRDCGTLEGWDTPRGPAACRFPSVDSPGVPPGC